MSSAWQLKDDLGDARASEHALGGGTVSLAFVAGTLQRLWFVWIGGAVLGVALAAAWLVLVPAPSTGTVTLLLAHEPETPPDAAMATDVSLLETRAVAQRVADELGLDTSPDELLETVVVEPTTSSVLRIDVRGSDREDAVRRADVFAATYLDYREQQLTGQAEAVTQTYRERIDALQLQVEGLTQQYDAVLARGGTEEEAAEVLSERGQLIGQITTLENEIEAVSLEANAVVVASRMLDEASVVPHSELRRSALGLGSGLVGGLALGLGLVLVYSLRTSRLRSRADVSRAMALPVKFSAPSVRHRPAGAGRASALDLLVDGLETAVPSTGKRPRRLSLISVDCEHEGAAVVAGLARRLAARGTVIACDLADTGLLARELGSPASAADAAAHGRVAVVSGPTTEAVSDVLLSLVPFDFGRGLAHVKSTSSRCVVLVKAGRSTTEQLDTVARSASTAGLNIQFVMLVGADASDASFGAAVVPG